MAANEEEKWALVLGSVKPTMNILRTQILRKVGRGLRI
jgi:hypothetical protein